MPDIKFDLSGVLKIITQPESKTPGTIITTKFDGFTVTAKGNKMTYTLPDDKKVNVKIEYVDANNHPAVVDGDVLWKSSDDHIATVVAGSPDTQTAVISAVDLGQAQITAKADADLGDGVRELLTTFDVEVVAGEAVAGRISPVGDPIPQ